MIDVKTPGSPGWWLQRCFRKLESRQPRTERLQKYRTGEPPLPKRSEVEKEAFKAFVKTSRLNPAETLISSISERLTPRAIRTAQGNTTAGDGIAWKIFRLNDLHVEFADVVDTALGLADAYMIIGVDPEVTGTPEAKDIWITSEDPRQVVTIHDPVRQSRLRAAAKFFHDPDEGDGGVDLAYLYLPGRVLVAERPRKRAGTSVAFDARSWQWRPDTTGEDGTPVVTLDDDGQPVGQRLPDGLEDVVPVVRVRNRHGVAEFEPHIDLLDRINHMILQRMVIVTMQAFRQRALKGEFPTHYPADYPVENLRGQEINYDEMFVSSPDAMWLIPGGADIWESAQADVQGVLKAVEDDLKHLAAVTRRPFWIFAPDNQSASGADHANDGLVFATEDRAVRFGQALARALSIAFRFMGDPDRAAMDQITVDWMPFERYGLQTKAQAAANAKTAGMSDTWILERVWQATPEEAALERQAKSEEMLTAAALLGATPASPEPAAAASASAATAQTKAAFDAINAAVRAGVDPEDAAARVGLAGIKFAPSAP